MKSSRFAVCTHILVVLAEWAPDPVSSEILAQSVGTSPAVIRQLMAHLRQADLVEAVLGPGGGSILTKAANQIKLSEIYSAVEEDSLIATHHCQPAQQCFVGRHILDTLDPIIHSATEAFLKSLSGRTVASVLKSLKKAAK